MHDFTTAPGKSYNETILEMMMFYPTIFPSENAAAQHLFLGYGTGFAWNKEGKLAYYLGEEMMRKKTPDRTKESILGEHKADDQYCNHCRFEQGKDPCFHSCGSNVHFWTHDLSQYSPISYVLSGEATPNEDWKKALSDFCFDALREDPKTYISFLRSYVKMVYPGAWKDWVPRYVSQYMELRKVARALRNKWHPHLARRSEKNIKEDVEKRMLKEVKRFLAKEKKAERLTKA